MSILYMWFVGYVGLGSRRGEAPCCAEITLCNAKWFSQSVVYFPVYSALPSFLLGRRDLILVASRRWISREFAR